MHQGGYGTRKTEFGFKFAQTGKTQGIWTAGKKWSMQRTQGNFRENTREFHCNLNVQQLFQDKFVDNISANLDTVCEFKKHF